MIRSRQFGIRPRGAGRRVIADARSFLFTDCLVQMALTRLLESSPLAGLPLLILSETKFDGLRYRVISVSGKRVTDVGARPSAGRTRGKQRSVNSMADGLAVIAESMIRKSMRLGSTRALPKTGCVTHRGRAHFLGVFAAAANWYAGRDLVRSR